MLCPQQCPFQSQIVMLEQDKNCANVWASIHLLSWFKESPFPELWKHHKIKHFLDVLWHEQIFLKVSGRLSTSISGRFVKFWLFSSVELQILQRFELYCLWERKAAKKTSQINVWKRNSKTRFPQTAFTGNNTALWPLSFFLMHFQGKTKGNIRFVHISAKKAVPRAYI